MKKCNRILPVLVALVIFCCSVVPAEASAIKQNITSVSLTVGQTRSFTLSGTTSKPSYKSSNTSVASVNQKGVITAKRQGTCTVTATWNKKKYTCKVTVYKSGTYVGKYKKNYPIAGTNIVTTWRVAVKSVSGNKIRFQIDWGNIRTVHFTGVITGTLIGNKVSFSFKDSHMSHKGTGRMWLYPDKVKLITKLGDGEEETRVLSKV